MMYLQIPGTLLGTKVKVKSLSRVSLFATPWTTAHQALRPWIFQARVLEWGAIAFSVNSH